MARRGSEKTICEACGRKRAGGGFRFCYRCLGYVFDAMRDTPTPTPPSSGYTYPPPKRKKRSE